MIAVLLAAIAIAALASLIGYVVYELRKPKRTYDDWGFNSAMLSVFVVTPLLCAAFLPTALAYVSQVSDQESLLQLRQQRAIYIRKADDLTAQFKSYLAVKYPAYEKSVIDEVSRSNAGSLISLYPQLRTADTVMLLVNQIRDLNNSIYQQGILAAKVEKDIRVRARNPFYLPGVF